MKKISFLLCLAMAVMMVSCGTSVNKEELLQKLKDKSELTQDDYSGLISILEDDTKAVEKWYKENPEAERGSAPEELKQTAMEMFEIGVELDEAARKDKLDNKNKRKLNKVLNSMKELDQ